MTTSEEIARAARGCVGARFRPQGRGADGLDCVGVAAVAFGGHLRADGAGATMPSAAATRRRSARRSSGPGCGRSPWMRRGEGDLLLLATGPGQWHFAVLTGDGFVHADARLRRVVETPGRPRWPVAGAWRIARGRG